MLIPISTYLFNLHCTWKAESILYFWHLQCWKRCRDFQKLMGALRSLKCLVLGWDQRLKELCKFFLSVCLSTIAPASPFKPLCTKERFFGQVMQQLDTENTIIPLCIRSPIQIQIPPSGFGITAFHWIRAKAVCKRNRKLLITWLRSIQMDSGLKTMHTDTLRRNESDGLHPNDKESSQDSSCNHHLLH